MGLVRFGRVWLDLVGFVWVWLSLDFVRDVSPKRIADITGGKLESRQDLSRRELKVSLCLK